MSQDDADRTEAPSAKRLEDARRKGDGPRSTELAVALSYLGAGSFLALWGPSALDRSGSALALLVEAGARGHVPRTAEIWSSLAPLVAMIAVPAALVTAGLIAQRSTVVAPGKLAPKLSRISPLSNAKQKYGPTGLVEFGKSALKLVAVCAIVAAVLLAELPTIVVTPALPERAAAVAPFPVAVALIWPMVAVAGTLAAADLLWQRFDFERRNRMTHKEIRDEAKEAEGDPQLKANRRARAEQIATRQMLGEVSGADVVVMNPTHYAVALRWSRVPGSAPVCVAKGYDEIALRIRDAAVEAGVPVRVDPPLARTLHAAADLGREVPPETWRAVAALIRYADAVRRAKGAT